MSVPIVIYSVAGVAFASVLIALAFVYVIYRRRVRRAHELQRAHEEAERRRRKRRRAGLRSAEINAAAPEKLVVSHGQIPAYNAALAREAVAATAAALQTAAPASPGIQQNHLQLLGATNVEVDVAASVNGEDAASLSVSTENDHAPSSPASNQPQQRYHPQGYPSPSVADDLEAELHASGHSGHTDDRFSELDLCIDSGLRPNLGQVPEIVHTDRTMLVIEMDPEHKTGDQQLGKVNRHAHDEHHPDNTGKSDRAESAEPPAATELADGEDTCAVCLDELVVGNRVRRLPCDHVFHSDCIRTWLRRKNACPCCCTPVVKRRKKKRKKADDINSTAPPQEINNLSEVLVDGADSVSAAGENASVATSRHTLSHREDLPSNGMLANCDMAAVTAAARHARPAQVQVHQMSSPALIAAIPSSSRPDTPSKLSSNSPSSRIVADGNDGSIPTRRLDDRRESDVYGGDSSAFGSFLFDRSRVPRSMSSRGFQAALSPSGTMTIGTGFPRNGSLLDPEDPTSGYLTSEASSHFDEPIDVLLDHVRRVLRGEASLASIDGYSTDGEVPDPCSVPDAAYDDEQTCYSVPPIGTNPPQRKASGDLSVAAEPSVQSSITENVEAPISRLPSSPGRNIVAGGAA